MPTYADIVFPTAVRQAFTYALPEDLVPQAKAGKRVWVPFQRHKAIGMIVRLHNKTPDFKTRKVQRILDEEPVMSADLLKLTEWIYRFYYCGWGEVIQAALPLGLNFKAQKCLTTLDDDLPDYVNDDQQEIIGEVLRKNIYPLDEAQKRWSEEIIDKLVGQKLLEVREEPVSKMVPSTEKVWSWCDEHSQDQARQVIKEHKQKGHQYKWIKALEKLLKWDLPEYQRELTADDLLEHYTLNRIAEEGLLRDEEVKATNISFKYQYDPSQLNTLNEEQEEAFGQIGNKLSINKFASFLLYGVTGSGKTEVYIHALKQALSEGKGGLILVPEIGLTPQIVERFYTIFGDDIAVLHSRLTNRERYDAWQALREGEKRIAIGARSAVFAPVQNLGLIVVDEEHDASYKQEDPAPRYHGRDVAIMRASINDATIVIGSATPSLVSLYGAKKGKSSFLELTKRPFEAQMPEIEVLDLKQYRSAMRGPLAVPLYQSIEAALERDEQTILLYNRRGFSSYLQCEACGEIPECPHCSVTLTYHKSKKQLRCHYCGYSERKPRHCEHCGHDSFVASGSGTQQLEQQISELFPGDDILRMDFDTTSGKNAHANILKSFGRGEANILVGTQIVGKGLDFPDVTVVGVIDADTELAFPSFRSGERMYQLLSQVAGRSGRAGKAGMVFFQTWQSDHPAVQTAQNHQYKAFARQELRQRKMLQYPPYSRLIRFVFKAKDEQKLKQVAQRFTGCLSQVLQNTDAVLGPSPAAIVRVQNFYRWESFIKISPSNGANAIEELIDKAFSKYNNRKPAGASSVRINVHVDALE